MNWIINLFLILFIPHIIMRILQIFKCIVNKRKCYTCSWIDICHDIYENTSEG